MYWIVICPLHDVNYPMTNPGQQYITMISFIVISLLLCVVQFHLLPSSVGIPPGIYLFFSYLVSLFSIPGMKTRQFLAPWTHIYLNFVHICNKKLSGNIGCCTIVANVLSRTQCFPRVYWTKDTRLICAYISDQFYWKKNWLIIFHRTMTIQKSK